MKTSCNLLSQICMAIIKHFYDMIDIWVVCPPAVMKGCEIMFQNLPVKILENVIIMLKLQN